jgi:hypothetical protein
MDPSKTEWQASDLEECAQPHLALSGACKNAINQGCLGHFFGRLVVQAGQGGFVHGIQQCHQVLVRILLPPQPEAATITYSCSPSLSGTVTLPEIGRMNIFLRQRLCTRKASGVRMQQEACQCNYDNSAIICYRLPGRQPSISGQIAFIIHARHAEHRTHEAHHAL